MNNTLKTALPSDFTLVTQTLPWLLKLYPGCSNARTTNTPTIRKNCGNVWFTTTTEGRRNKQIFTRKQKKYPESDQTHRSEQLDLFTSL